MQLDHRSPTRLFIVEQAHCGNPSKRFSVFVNIVMLIEKTILVLAHIQSIAILGCIVVIQSNYPPHCPQLRGGGGGNEYNSQHNK